MSRSGYSDNLDTLVLGRWRGMVSSAMRGKRGQALFCDMLAALDALPEKKLIASALVAPDGCVCALGALAQFRGMDVSNLDPEDVETVAAKFDIAEPLAKEIVYENDECGWNETPEQRFQRVRAWVQSGIKKDQVREGAVS